MGSIVHTAASPSPSPQQIRQSIQLAALGELLPDDEVEDLCNELGHDHWRQRDLPPGVTLRSMVWRALHPDHSIAGMLADLAALMGPDVDAPTDSAWCQARSRLPEGVLTKLISRRARECRRRFGAKHRWNGRWVFRVDGSTVSMPDEPSLVKAFGYAKTRHGPSRFPVARITFVELAGLDVIWDWRLDKYTRSEESQFLEMLENLPRGCILLMDRKFCSFYMLAKTRQRRIGVITLLNARRDPQALIRKGRRIGPNQWIVPLDLGPQLRRKYDDPTLPQKLWVRLIRVSYQRGDKGKTRILWVVSTLMDPQRYPAHQVAKQYRSRWDIEPRIGSLKTTLEMNVLRSKGPAAARREVASMLLGHNLVWMLMHEAAHATRTPVERISFAGAVKTALAFSPALRQAQGPMYDRVYQQMLRHIARQTNHHPRDRVEPRLIKRETSRYSYLREPRAKARQRCLS